MSLPPSGSRHLPGRIALVHALPESMAPMIEAFARLWPEACVFNLLDEALSQDRARAPMLSSGLHRRVTALLQHALDAGDAELPTRGVVFTGTAFGPAVREMQQRCAVPVLLPHEAAFAEASTAGRQIALLATFAPSLALLEDDLRSAIESSGSKAGLRAVFVPQALQALQRGDTLEHDELIAAAARQQDADLFVLGQFSMARAARHVATATGRRVVTTPDSTVAALRRMLTR